MRQNLSFVLGVIIMAFAGILRKNRKMIGLLVILVDIPVFTAGLIFIGSLSTWFRYWVYAVPFGAVLIGAIYRLMKRGSQRKIMMALLVGLFVLSTLELDLQRLGAYIFDPQAELALREDDGYYAFYNDGPILADKIDELSEEGLVMVDASKSHFVIMEVEHPERLMITNDRDFQDALRNPRGKLAYILVPEVDNIFSRNYPGIYDGAYDWAQLAYDFPDTMGHYRVFAILP
jgi:hypothetical protein